MIIYHPAYDINHCAFRFITLLLDIEENRVSWEHLQILDLYYVFPQLMSQMQLPKNASAARAALRSMPEPYESLPDARQLMFGLAALHNEAARALVAKGIIDREQYLRNVIKLQADRIPSALHSRIQLGGKRSAPWYRLLVDVLATWPMEGKKGLKERTKLMEYRYDA